VLQPNWASVDIIDDYTIRVNFTEWMNTLPSSFADAANMAYMVSKTAFDKNSLAWMRANPVGTGPFKFGSFTLDASLKFVKNPDYWVKGKPYLDGIDYVLVADPMTQKMTMESGEGDMVDEVTGKLVADYAAMGLNLNPVFYMTNLLVPDTANAGSPWAKKEVREAVEYAIDREAIAKTFGYGHGQAMYQIPSPYSLAYNPDFTLGRKYDPEKAKQLLAEAGYPDGFKTTIIAVALGDKDTVTVLQAYLAKAGIQTELDFPEWGKWVTYMGPGKWPENSALYLAIPAINKHYTGGLQFMFSMLGQSWLRTPEFLEAYRAAITSPAPDIKLIRAVTDMMTKDALLIPVDSIGGGRVQRPYVMVGYNERGSFKYWNTEDAWLKK
jgi:ABC-type transport system substrate-binding protein